MDLFYKNKYIKYKNKYLELKLIGGTLEELYSLSLDEKVIILVGERHQNIVNMDEYDKIIKKQNVIYELLVEKYGKEHTYFYSEAPEEFRSQVLSDIEISSSIVVQNIMRRNPDKVILSSITACNRKVDGSCDDKYALDIAKIYKKEDTKCVMAVVGLLHVEKIKELLLRFLRDEVKIIIINTVSQASIYSLMPEITKHRPDLLQLLKKEPPYDIPPSSMSSAAMPSAAMSSAAMSSAAMPSFFMSTARPSNRTFNPIIIIKDNGKKVYKCPICKSISGTAAPENPTDTSLFFHTQNPICPNSGAIPVEE